MADELTCLVALHSVPGIGHRSLQRLLERFGSAERAVMCVAESDLRAVAGLSPEVQRGILACQRKLPWAERIAQQMRKLRVRPVLSGQPDYPARLNDLSAPPWILYLLGEATCFQQPGVAVVGSTKPSPKGKSLAAGIAARVARAGCAVVSGMAVGIDQAAHAGAVEVGGSTVFVLPTGILQFRPGGHFPPIDELLKNAVAVSELAPETEWTSSAAVARNRIIAALASVVVVVETRSSGGAMHTFRDAQELGRPVWVVKYREAPPSASGNNVAIARGGLPLSTLSEVQAIIEAAHARSTAG